MLHFLSLDLHLSAITSIWSRKTLQSSSTLLARVPPLVTHKETNTVWLIKIPLPTRKSNSVTTCWGARAGGPIPEGTVSQTLWSHGLLMYVWVNERQKELTFDGRNALHKSFPFHLCAGSDPKVRTHRSVVPTDIAADPLLPAISTSRHALY